MLIFFKKKNSDCIFFKKRDPGTAIFPWTLQSFSACNFSKNKILIQSIKNTIKIPPILEFRGQWGHSGTNKSGWIRILCFNYWSFISFICNYLQKWFFTTGTSRVSRVTRVTRVSLTENASGDLGIHIWFVWDFFSQSSQHLSPLLVFMSSNV